MKRSFFIAGTDTNVGKTTVGTALIKEFVKAGYQALGIKPLSCGLEKTEAGWQHWDAMSLMEASNVKIPYEFTNPIALKAAIAPHIAAEYEGVKLTVSNMIEAIQPALSTPAELVLVESVGGWQVPLNLTETMADYAIALGFPVILVVGIRLGCLNHALLTIESITHSGLEIAGWYANIFESNDKKVDLANVETLKQRIKAPYIGDNAKTAVQNLV